MTHPNLLQRGASAAGRDAHTFAVGQTVILRDGLRRPIQPGMIYRITGRLPASGGAPQYRIRHEDERYERMVTEDSLQQADLPASNGAATLIERTFGRG